MTATSGRAEGNAGDGGRWELDHLVRALHDARRNAEPDMGLSRRVRPSRDALLHAVRSLRSALFPSHFAPPEFTEQSTELNIDFFVGHTLYTALHGLEEQVRRVLRFDAPPPGPDASPDTHEAARTIVATFAATLPAVRLALERDIRAAFEGDPAATSRAEIVFCYPGVRAIMLHRFAHELYRLKVPILPRMISEIAHEMTGIDIHPGASIGESFFIDHGTGIVIGETTIIGNRVSLYQGVTLGARNFPVDSHGVAIKGLPRHPIIEDDVVIYSGATVLGRITVGKGSRIGGNVWLTHSVPPNSRVTQAQTRQEVFEAGAGI